MDSTKGFMIGRKGAGLRPFAMTFGPEVRDERISDGAFRTLKLLDLLEGADREGRHCVGLIARLRNTSDRTVQRHLTELKDAGMIEVEYLQGETNRILIVEPTDVYGRGAIGGFYDAVRKESREMRGGDTNVTTPPTKMSPPPPTKMSPRVDDGGVDDLEQSPTGACCHTPSNTLPGKEAAEEGRTLPVSEHGDESREEPQNASGEGGGCGQTLEGAKPPVAGQAEASPSVLEDLPKENGVGGGGGANNVRKAHTVCAGAGSKVMPWEKEEEESGRRPKKPRKTGLYDPSKPVSEWNGNDLVGYFRSRFKETWPGEGAPDVRIEDLGSAKRRIVWMKDEGMDLSLAKSAIDHLFQYWSDGLPGRLRWKGSRPGIAIIGTARLFEMLVREVQNGVAPGKTSDEWKGGAEVEKYQKKGEIRARLMDEGLTLEQADREASRLAGL